MLDTVPPPVGDDLAWKKWAERTIQALAGELARVTEIARNRT